MVLITKSTALPWKSLINAAKNIHEEALFEITDDGITLKLMDASHVSMIITNWPKERFLEFKNDGMKSFGLALFETSKMINRFDDKDIVTGTIDDKGVILESPKKRFEFRAIHASGLDLPRPKAELDASITVKIDDFLKLLNDVIMLNEVVTFAVEDNVLYIKTADSDTKSKAQVTVGEIDAPEDIKAMYNTEYFKFIAKELQKATEDVKISFSEDKPMCMTFESPEIGTIEYFMAPINTPPSGD